MKTFFHIAAFGIIGALSLTHAHAALMIPPQPNAQDKATTESASASSACASAMHMIDRSGMDRASIHLQILQQTSTRYDDGLPVRKNLAEEKKTQGKASHS